MNESTNYPSCILAPQPTYLRSSGSSLVWWGENMMQRDRACAGTELFHQCRHMIDSGQSDGGNALCVCRTFARTHSRLGQLKEQQEATSYLTNYVIMRSEVLDGFIDACYTLLALPYQDTGGSSFLAPHQGWSMAGVDISL